MPLISDFGIASMLNHIINLDFGSKIYGMINMKAIPKFDIKSDIKFDISTKVTTWIGQYIFHAFCAVLDFTNLTHIVYSIS